MTSPRSLRWGIIFIAAGILWLLVSNDTISHSVFYYLLALWPVLLIAIGIELIFRRTRLHALAYVSPLIIALAIFFAGREAYFVEQGDHDGRGSVFVQEVGDVETLQAVIELGDYNLFVRARADNKLRGYMSGQRSRPSIDYRQSNSSGLFEVKDNHRWLDWDWDVLPNVHLAGRRWRDPELRVDLPQDKLVSLQLHGDDSEVDLNLADLSLKELIARVNEVSLSLEIGS
ncbi:MAG TPA: DUF5668 domain-containing protein, partial [candidate division Zixibacteria bacterium]|nr:DUF5668 domain-containing protein [candidate division Zixibacteria bacterium]